MPTTASSYDYDATEHFVIDQNIESEAENTGYDHTLNLRYCCSSSLNSELQEKTFDRAFFVLDEIFVVTKGGDKTIFRQGTSKESVTRLNRKAQEAENSNIGIHGVSGSTTKTPGCSSASCSSLEKAGFKVHPTPTRADPNHVTIELPKPVTKEAAKTFNDLLGRQ